MVPRDIKGPQMIENSVKNTSKYIKNTILNIDSMQDGFLGGNKKVILSLLPSALRGLILQRGKGRISSEIPAEYRTCFNWEYGNDKPALDKLYKAAKKNQWNGETDLDWSTQVDFFHPDYNLLKEDLVPMVNHPSYRRLTRREKQGQGASILAWLLSQFLHGEQGALFAACQITQSVQWMDAKMYGSTQVVDEGRHVEVFKRYLEEKLHRIYEINDNLYVILDALMTDPRWDMKFLGMQILVEGLALGAFGTLRQSSEEPLLRDLLKYVITDEARHVHFGVVALQDYYTNVLHPKEVAEREDWAYEICVFMRNRFMAHEFYDEYYAHTMSRRSWDKMIGESKFMETFRRSLFKRIIPNLKRIGLLSDRIRPKYEQLGLLVWENGKAAPELTSIDLL